MIEYYKQTTLDGAEYWSVPDPKVPVHTKNPDANKAYELASASHSQNITDHVGIHRLCAVAWFGFDSFDSDSVVHHINNIPWDNREDNLKVMSNSEHSKLHNP